MSVCLNFADIVYTNSWTSQTTNLASMIAITAPAGGGLYRVSSTVSLHTNTGNAGMNLTWNDGNSNQSANVVNALSSGGSTPNTVLTNSCVSFFVAGGQDISIIASVSGGATYDLYVAIEKLI